MPPKRRKFESTFPAARIKKIMQLDDDVGRVASSVPILISRAVEIFLQALLSRTADYASSRNAKTLTVLHLKHCIEQEKQWDFLKDLTAKISEVGKQVEGEDGSAPRRGRKRHNSQSKVPSGKRKHVEGEEKEESERSGDEGEGVERPQPASSQTSSSSVPLLQRLSATTSIPVSVLVTPAAGSPTHLTSTSTLPPLSQQQPTTLASIPAASSSSQPQNSSGSEAPPLAIFSAGLQRTVSNEEEEDYDA